MRRCLLATAFVSAMFGATVSFGVARAQMITSREGIALENQILELKQQLGQQQSGQMGNGGSALAPPQGNYAPAEPGANGAASMIPNLLQEVQTLQDQVQSLRGRVDTLEHEVATQHDEINQEIGDLKFQLGQSGQQKNPAGLPAPPAAAPSVRNRPAAAALSALSAPAAAEKALAAHDYRGAEADAQAMLAKTRSGPAGAEAQFIRARALAGEGNSQSAAIAYDDAYNAEKTGPQAPYALLGLANSLSNLRQNQAACDTLDSLSSQFSSPSAALSRDIHAARAKAHCG